MNKGNPRELIRKHTTMDGRVIEIRMPTTGDLLDAQIQGRNVLEALVEAGTGLTYEEFRNLPLPDGSRILIDLNGAIEVFNEYLKKQ